MKQTKIAASLCVVFLNSFQSTVNMENKVKRERAINFTSNEIRILIYIVLKYVNAIENKQTHSVSWKEKDTRWISVAEEFNSLSGSIHRTAKVLRLKYDVIKRNLKKKSARNKQEIFKTGGGIAVIETFTDSEQKLYQILELSVEGLPS